jgi:nitroreductase
MNVADIDAAAVRVPTPDTDVHPMFPSRWSPRAMTGERLEQQELLTLLEAARWAPSCFNAQPWRFAWALKGSAGWQTLFDCLLEGNQRWADKAGALIAVISRTEYEHNGKPAPTHAFDAGAAWMSLALQARHLGLVAHGMQGFDSARLRSALAVPEVYFAPAVIAIGYPGNVEDLPDPLGDREVPSSRRPLSEIAYADSFVDLPEGG